MAKVLQFLDISSMLGKFQQYRTNKNIKIKFSDFPESELDRIIQAAYAQYDYEKDSGNIEFNARDMVEGNFENFFRWVFYLSKGREWFPLKSWQAEIINFKFWRNHFSNLTSFNKYIRTAIFPAWNKVFLPVPGALLPRVCPNGGVDQRELDKGGCI